MLESRKVLPLDWHERITPIDSNLVDPRTWN
jgi:hypothetical protein